MGHNWFSPFVHAEGEPVLSEISPSAGTTAGGTLVTITGTNLNSGVLNTTNLYQQEASITNASGSTLTNYQILLEFNSQSLISANKMKNDGGDIRILSGDGFTVLNHWIDPDTINTTSTDLWVKVPSIPTTGTTILLTYGDLTQTSTSSGDNTFEFFDDFDDGVLDTNKWNIIGSTANMTESNGYLTITNNEVGSNGYQITTGIVAKSYSGGPGIRLDTTIRDTDGVSRTTVLGSLSPSNSTAYISSFGLNQPMLSIYQLGGYLSFPTTTTYGESFGTARGNSTMPNTGATSDWSVYSIDHLNNSTSRYYKDGTLGSTHSSDANVPDIPLYPALGATAYYGGAGNTQQHDLIKVRKIVGTPPTYSLGSEAGISSNISITIGGQPATDVTVVNATTITARTPAHAVGTVDVVVSYDGTPYTLSGAFTYSLPVLSSVSPNTGSTGGGETVTIHGNYFPVNIGGTQVTEVSYTNQGTQTSEVTHNDIQYVVHQYKTAGTAPFVPPEGVTEVEYLIVAGGGGGGANAGGGGGAGGLLTNLGGTPLTVTQQTYTVTVGAGGTGGPAANPWTGTNGGNSSFAGLTAIGGGRGGGATSAGLLGGSGGGGGYNNALGGAGTAGQGNNGGSGLGNAVNNTTGGGGGGAGSVGSNATSSTIAGNGGSGISNAITGSAVTYAGGGGGGSWTGTAGTGGTGGGGNGTNSSATAASGTANTGSGGGGGGYTSSAGAGGAGGSGIVVIRYPLHIVEEGQTLSATFGGVAATNVTIVDEQTITATVPAHAVGTVDVVVDFGDSTQTLIDGYTYSGPQVSSVTPNTAPSIGGMSFTLSGDYFSDIPVDLPAEVVSQGDETTTVTVGDIEYVVHQFKTTGSSSFTPPEGVTNVEYLIVGGGGGGAVNNPTGAGGGGGGIRTGTVPVSLQSYPITVGTGGNGTSASNTAGTNGANSTAFGLTAGGGRGDDRNANASGTPQSNPAGPITGFYVYNQAGGGAGGAGQANGVGGVGLQSSITGSNQYYGGGGGAGGDGSTGTSRGAGGAGGGGFGSSASLNSTAGTANTGGGGGGGSTPTGRASSAGGSGIVVIRYERPTTTSPGVPVVTFGGVEALNVTYIDGSTLTGTVPAHALGTVDVVVTNPDGSSGTLAGGFTYAGPSIDSISPTSGPISGGTDITISGSNFFQLGSTTPSTDSTLDFDTADAGTFSEQNASSTAINGAVRLQGSVSGPHTFEDAYMIGSTGGDVAYDVAVDSTGNIYSTGYFHGTVDFDPSAGTDLKSAVGGSDVFVMKMNADGSYGTTYTFGGTLGDVGNGIAVDSSGNIFITGYFTGTADLDPTVGVSNKTAVGSNDGFFVKINANGTFGYAYTYGGSGSNDIGRSIRIDAQDNVYYQGTFSDQIDMDPTAGVDTKGIASSTNSFVTKINVDGTYGYTHSYNSIGDFRTYEFDLDSSGNIFLFGAFAGTVDFNPTAGTDSRSSAGGNDLYLSKMNANGTYGFTYTFGGISTDYGFDVRIDDNDNIFVTGEFGGTVDFNPTAGTDNRTSVGANDAFITKINADGSYGFTRTIGGSGTDWGMQIEVDMFGNIFWMGTFFESIDLDPGGGVDSRTRGSYSPFIVVLDASGIYQYGYDFGSTNNLDEIWGSDMDAVGNLYLAGYIQGTADIDPTASTLSVNSLGSADGFVIKLGASLTYPTTPAYVTTTDTSQLDTTEWGSMIGVGLTQTTRANTSIKYLISFDGRTTWKYWNGSAWATSALATIETNGMSKTVIERLQSDDWGSLGGFSQGVTTSVDFAVSLDSNDASVTPSLDQIHVVYTTGDVGVTFGGVSATNVTVVDSSTISATTPAHPNGAVDVRVINPDGESDTLVDGFTYISPITVTDVDGPFENNSDAVDITITGTNFEAGSTVTLSKTGETDISCGSVVINSATSLTCTADLLGVATGDWDVTVTLPSTDAATLSGGLTVNAGIYKLNITTNTQTIVTGTPSFFITIQALDYNDQPVIAAENYSITLATTSGTGVFSTSKSTWSNTTTLPLLTGNSEGYVYYRDTTVGTPTITVSNSTEGWQSDTYSVTIVSDGYYQWTFEDEALYAFDTDEIGVGLSGNSLAMVVQDATMNSSVSPRSEVALPYSTITSFTVEPGITNEGVIEYHITNDDGSTWYYHNGSAWVTAPAATYSTYTNTAAEINANISSFSALGAGVFRFTAFLHGENVDDSVSLDTVQVGYTYVDPTVTITSPVDSASTTWTRGTTHMITWNENLNGGSTPDNGEFDDMTLTLIDSETNETSITSNIDGDGSYSWSIPSNLTPGVYTIQLSSNVTNVHYASLEDTATVTIQDTPSLTITSPNGGEIIKSGSLLELIWTNTLFIGSVNLFYSSNNGSTWTSIATDETNDGSYFWTVAEDISDQMLIKVESTESAAIYDVSDAAFEVLQSLVVTSPNGGETLVIGNSEILTWDTFGLINDVVISISKDNFSTAEVIESSTPNNDTYSWTVPSTLLGDSSIGSNWKIRVQDVLGDNADSDVSDAVFTIAQMKVTAPAYNSVLQYGSTTPISWVANPAISTIDIYSVVDDGTPTLIASDVTTTAGTYNWIINATASDDVKIRIVDSSNESIYAESRVFTVTAMNYITTNFLGFTYPTASEQLVVGSTAPIAWNVTSAVWPRVNVVYSTDDFSTTHSIASDISNTGTYSWTVPDDVAGEVKLKVFSTALGSDQIVSEEFEIVGDLNLSVTSPSGATSFIGGRYAEVSWSLDAGTMSSGDYTLSYSTDDFSTSTNIGTGLSSSGSEVFQIPGVTTSNFDVRITYNGSPTFFTQLSNMNISAATYSLTGITAGNKRAVGSTVALAWNVPNTVWEQVSFYYSVDDFATSTPIAFNRPNGASGGSYTWTIPNDIESDVKVRAVSSLTDDDYIESQAFDIVGVISLLSPSVNTSSQLQVGSTVNLSWSTFGTVSGSNYTVSYSTNDGSSFTNIVTGQPATGSYAWTIPDILDDAVILKVAHTGTPSFESAVSGYNIMDAISVTSPSTSDVFLIGDTVPVTWTNVANLGNIDILYSTDGFVTSTTLVSNQAYSTTTGSYSWTIPSNITPTDQGKIRILKTGSTKTKGESGTFSVRGSISVSDPFDLTVGDIENVTFTYTGSTSQIRLSYSTNNGASYTPIPGGLVTVTGGAGSLNWTVPDAISNTVKIRAVDVDAPSTFDESDTFSISGSISLNSVTSVAVGVSKTLSWTKTGSIGNTKIEWSPAGQDTWTTIAPSVSGSSYPWLVPNTLNGSIDLRVSSVDYPTVLDTESNISLAKITLSAPSAGQTLVYGTTAPITFTADESVTNVDILFAEDGSTFNTTVLSNYPVSSGTTYSWTIPDVYTTTAKIKIQESGNASEYTESASFTVTDDLTITSPVSNDRFIVGTTANTITWNAAGSSVSNVKLEYSANGGTSWSTIVANTPNDGSYETWTTSSTATNTGVIKISAVGQVSSVADTSGVFSISQNLAITNISSSTVLIAGSTAPIAFFKPAAITSVNLYYAADGTTFGASPINPTPLTGSSFTWTVPSSKTTQGKLRIQAAIPVDSRFISTTDAFTIKGSVRVTELGTAGTSYLFGDAIPVTLSLVGTSNVDLYYLSSSDNYTAETAIPGGELVQNSATSYTWTPSIIANTTSVKVKAYDADDSTAFGISSTLNLGQAKFLSPTAATSLNTGTTTPITWDIAPGITAVTLELSDDNFATSSVIASGITAGDGTYNWTIGDISGSYKLRMKNSDTSEVIAISDTLTIQSSISNVQITTANPKRGNPLTVTWDSSGNIPNVRIEYKELAAASYTTLVSSVSNTETYTWNSPTIGKGMYTFRISDPRTNLTGNASVSASTLVGGTITSVSLTTTNQPTTTFTPGETVTLTWNSSNLYSGTGTNYMANVKIQYSIDGSTYVDALDTTDSLTANDGSFANWRVPNTTNDTLIVRVSDPDDVSVFGSTTVTLEQFKFIAPGDDVSVQVGSTYRVRWFSNTQIGTVDLLYSVDGGSFTEIATGISNVGFYDWTVPDVSSDDIVFKIQSTADGTISETSPTMSIAVPTVTFTTPQDGTVIRSFNSLASRGQVAITWPTTQPNIQRVQILGTYNNVTTVIANNYPYSSGVLNWNKTTLGSFAIQVRAVEYIYTLGQPITLSWSNTGSIATVGLYYSDDNFATSTPIAQSVSNTGSYIWTPTVTEHQNIRVRIVGGNVDQSTATSAVFDVSAFSITSPQSGSFFTSGKENTISWNVGDNVTAVDISYSLNAGSSWTSIVTNHSVVDDGSSYVWDIADSLGRAEDVLIRVHDSSNASNFVDSAAFDILPEIRYLTPGIQDELNAGDNVTITWETAAEVSSVRIVYIEEGSTDEVEIASSTGNSGSFVWSIPSDLEANIKIKIIDTQDERSSDESSTYLIVTAREVSINDSNIQYATILRAGSPFTIHWNNSAAVDSIDISYSTNNFASETIVTADQSTTAGEYEFTLPSISSTNFKVRIVDADYSSNLDTTSAFTIQTLGVIAPNTEVKFAYTQQIPVEVFFDTNAMTSVDILLVDADTESTVTILADDTATLTTTAAPNPGVYKIKVVDSSNVSISDLSDEAFTVKSLVITEPSVTFVPQADPYAITWAAATNVSFVTLSYSIDDGTTFTEIAGSIDATSGSYDWDIPSSLIGESITLKVEDAESASDFDITEGTFTVSAITINNFTNGGSILVTSPQTILWSAIDSISHVDIAYSNDNFVTINYLKKMVANDGTESISIPNEVMSGVKLRIYMAGTTTIYGESIGTYNFSRVIGVGVDGKNSQYPQMANITEGGNRFYSVVWRDGRDGNNEIYYAKYDDTGSKTVTDTQITDDAASSDYPSIAWDGDRLLIVWQDQRFGSLPQIMYQFINSNGTLSGTAKRLVNTVFESRNPDIAHSSQNNAYGIVWQDNRSGRNQVYFTTITDEGVRLQTDIRLTDNTSNTRSPRISVSTDGTFYVTYTDSRTGKNQVYVMQIDTDGSVIAPAVKISNSTGEAFYPDITYGSSLGVSWMDNRDGNYQIYFSRLTDELEVLVSESQISTSSVRAISPNLTYNPDDGTYSLAWVDYQGVGSSDIYFTRIDDQGTAIDGQTPMVTGFNDSTYPFINPAGDGRYALAWNERENGEYGVYFSLFYLGKVMQFDVKARPEKRFADNFEEEFTLQIRRSGITDALKTNSTPVGSSGQTSSTVKYGDLDDNLTYDVSIKSNAHLRKTLSNLTLVEGVNILDFTESETAFIQAGDVNSTTGDNTIDLSDITVIDNNFTADIRSDDRFDLNKDGKINGIEYSIIISNISESGDE